ncbi:unnamed protein product [Paramecium octaurelia]|uniref:Uncharacterized protein n=1 Tax=Paramecium octaurelia TaxID=43137 RepID=A0A8S1XCS8_PAROT|nr:unnamed protein product [Paramecium octaurelia]
MQLINQNCEKYFICTFVDYFDSDVHSKKRISSTLRMAIISNSANNAIRKGYILALLKFQMIFQIENNYYQMITSYFPQ